MRISDWSSDVCSSDLAVISAHVGRGIQLEAHGEANEPYPAFDGAADRLSKRLRRYKRRLRDHNSKAAEAASLPARQYILAAESQDESDEESQVNGQPAVVAEMTTDIPMIPVTNGRASCRERVCQNV